MTEMLKQVANDVLVRFTKHIWNVTLPEGMPLAELVSESYRKPVIQNVIEKSNLLEEIFRLRST